jgi:hypothetical protein
MEGGGLTRRGWEIVMVKDTPGGSFGCERKPADVEDDA